MGLSKLSIFRPARDSLLVERFRGSQNGHQVAAPAMTNNDQFFVMVCGSIWLNLQEVILWH